MNIVPLSDSFVNYQLPFSSYGNLQQVTAGLQSTAIGTNNLSLLYLLQNSLTGAVGGQQGSHYSVTMRFPSDNGGQLPPITTAMTDDGNGFPSWPPFPDPSCCHHEQTTAIQEDGGWPPIDPRQQQMQQLIRLLIMIQLLQCMSRYPNLQPPSIDPNLLTGSDINGNGTVFT